MNKRNWALMAVVLMAAGTLMYTSSQAPAAPEAGSAKAEIGKQAPNFTLEDIYGKSFSLSDFKDKVVVLQWFNPGCPVIQRVDKQEIMQGTLAKYAEKGAVWVAIDSTAGAKAENNRVYAAKHGLSFPILMDPKGKVGKMYGATSTPHCYVIDKKGKLVYMGAIDDDPSGSKKEATNYVADAIGAVLAGKDVETPRTKAYGCGVKYARSGS